MESSDHEQTQAAGGPCTHVTIIISGQSVRVEVVKCGNGEASVKEKKVIDTVHDSTLDILHVPVCTV